MPRGDDERLSRVDLAVLATAALAGIALRVWVVRSPLGVLDSDEAVVGLMARRIAFHGDLPVFFWGQQYGGSLEPLLVAAVFRVVGSSTVALKAVPLALCASATVLVAHLGTQLVGRRRALYAAAAFWIATGNYLWWSTKARGFYWATLNLGLVLLLLLLRVLRRPDDTRAWLAFGFVAGVGWWTSPQILYFALPAVAWVIAQQRSSWDTAWRPLLLSAAPAAVLGALPWLYANVRSGFASFDYNQPDYSYLQHLKVFFEKGIPVLLGLHALEQWIIDVAFPLVYAVVLVLLAVGLLTRRHRLGVLVLFVVAYPLIFAVFPASFAVGEGRYLLFLAPAVWLVLATVPPSSPSARWRAVLPLLLVPIGVLAVVDLHTIEDHSLPLAVDVLVPNDDRDLLDALAAHHVTRASADYWLAYRTTFETDERVVVAPDIVDQIRYPLYTQTVRAADDAARIFLAASRREAEFRQTLADAPECVRRVEAGTYVLYLPITEEPCASVAARKLRT